MLVNVFVHHTVTFFQVCCLESLVVVSLVYCSQQVVLAGTISSWGWLYVCGRHRLQIRAMIPFLRHVLSCVRTCVDTPHGHLLSISPSLGPFARQRRCVLPPCCSWV